MSGARAGTCRIAKGRTGHLCPRGLCPSGWLISHNGWIRVSWIAVDQAETIKFLNDLASKSILHHFHCILLTLLMVHFPGSKNLALGKEV